MAGFGQGPPNVAIKQLLPPGAPKMKSSASPSKTAATQQSGGVGNTADWIVIASLPNGQVEPVKGLVHQARPGCPLPVVRAEPGPPVFQVETLDVTVETVSQWTSEYIASIDGPKQSSRPEQRRFRIGLTQDRGWPVYSPVASTFWSGGVGG